MLGFSKEVNIHQNEDCYDKWLTLIVKRVSAEAERRIIEINFYNSHNFSALEPNGKSKH